MPQPLAVILRAGGLGDTVLALPPIASIRSALPDWRIRIVGYPAYCKLALPLVDELAAVDAPRKTWFADAALVVAWSKSKPQVGCRLIHASPFPPPGVHASDWLLGSLPADLRRARLPPFAHLTRRFHESGAESAQVPFASRPVIIHPGAGGDWKRWPAVSFARLALRLANSGIPVTVVDGPADELAMAEFRSALGDDEDVASPGVSPEILRCGSDVALLASQLCRARAFVGNDSGVTHLAAALGVPTVALFGPTDPINWAARPARVVRACARTSQRQSEVRVCFDSRCMEAIPVDMVLRALEDVVAARAC